MGGYPRSSRVRLRVKWPMHFVPVTEANSRYLEEGGRPGAP